MMNRKRFNTLAAAGVTATLAGCSGAAISGESQALPKTPNASPIKHVIISCQENHSFDHYFGYAPFAGEYGIPKGYHQPSTLNPGSVPKYPRRLKGFKTGDPAHDWGTIHSEWNHGRMNGFYWANGALAMGFYDGEDLPFYYDLFKSATLCGNFHCSLLGPTYPNRLYLFAGTSGGLTTNFINPGSLDYPCILDLLDRAGVSFKCYNVGQDCCDTGNNVFVLFRKYRNDPRVTEATDETYLKDLEEGRLPQVSFIMSADENAEHPGYDIQPGMRYQEQFINALKRSQFWPTSAYFLTYDEAGGYFDHVAPPVFDAFGAGIRVPTFVVSPFAKTSHIEGTLYDHSSILKFVEYVFGLPTLASVNHHFDHATPSGANYQAANGKSGPPAPPRDALAATGDMRECFNGV